VEVVAVRLPKQHRGGWGPVPAGELTVGFPIVNPPLTIGGGQMSDTAANEAVAHRWHREIFQEGQLEVADEILAHTFVFHSPVGEGKGPDEAKQLATGFRTVFPDLAIAHEDTVAAGDKVAIHWTARATHQAEFEGVPATGKPIRFSGIDMYQLKDGKLDEAWIVFDRADVLQQMGAALQ